MGRWCLPPRAMRNCVLQSKVTPFWGLRQQRSPLPPPPPQAFACPGHYWHDSHCVYLGADETAGNISCRGQIAGAQPGKLSGATTSAERKVIQLPGIRCILMCPGWCPGSSPAFQENSFDEHPQPLEYRARQGTRQDCSEWPTLTCQSQATP